MRENPTWYVPKSIQDKWARAGKVVKKTVPTGPENLFWRSFWIGLSLASYGSHCNKPISIYDFQSRGAVCECTLLTSIPTSGRSTLGQPGEIIYAPSLL